VSATNYRRRRHRVRVSRGRNGIRIRLDELTWSLHDQDFLGVVAQVATAIVDRADEFSVVELELSGQGVQAMPWEAALNLPLPVVRTSLVPPRALGQPFTVPVRLLQVDMAIRQDLSRQDLPLYDLPMRQRSTSSAQLATFQAEMRWPGIDVVHVTGADVVVRELNQSGRYPLSTRLDGAPGTLGWLERLCARSRARLLTLEGTGERQLTWLRRIAAMLVDRGGPPVVINDSENSAAIWAFYDRMLHDVPLDIAQRGSGLTLTMGRGAAGLLRPSSIEAGLRDLARRLSDDQDLLRLLSNAPSRRAAQALTSREFGLGWFLNNDLNFALNGNGLRVLERRLDDARELIGIGRISRVGGLLSLRSVWPEPAVNTTERYLDVALLDGGRPLVAGRHYQVSIDIGPPELITTSLRALAVLDEVFAWRPDQDGAWAEVAITPMGLRVHGSLVQQVWVPRTGPSQRIQFTVTPQSHGVQAARICLYVNQNIVQSVKIAARCTDRKTEAPPVSELARALRLPEYELGEMMSASSIEYALHDLTGTTPSRTLSLVVNDHSGVAVTTVKGQDVFAVHTSADLPTLVEEVRLALEDTACPANPDGTRPLYAFNNDNSGSDLWFDRRMQALAEVGWKLYVEVFKQDRDKLSGLMREEGTISVAHVLLDHVIPWAAVYDRKFTPDVDTDADGNQLLTGTCLAGLPKRRGTLPTKGCRTHPKCLLRQPGYTEHTVACARHFWGFRHQIELPAQQSADGDAPEPASPRVTAAQTPLMTTAMHGGLRFVDQHIAELRQATSAASRPAKVEEPQFARNPVIHDLCRTDQDIVYLYCHAEGGYGTSSTEPAFRVRRRRESAEPSEPPEELPIRVQHVAAAPWTNSPLVVLNGCRTGAFRPNALSKFIAEFVYARRAGGILATEIPIFEELTAEIGTRFVRDFLDGKSAGQALLLIRRDLLRRKNPLGLAYTLYATMDFYLGGEGPGRRTSTTAQISAGGGSVRRPEHELIVASTT